MSTENTAPATVSDQTIDVSIKDVLDMLTMGKTREEVRVHYGLTKTQLVALFKHPKLKGRKTHTAASVLNVIDDADNIQPLPTRAPRTVATPTTPVVDETVSVSADNTASPAVEATPEVIAPAAVEEQEQATPDTDSPWNR